jgi:hypothetical protein
VGTDPTTPQIDDTAIWGIIGTIAVVGLIFWVLGIIIGWKIFTKAGQPGWASIIPIYNVLVFLKIIGRPWYWLLLMCIPFVGVIWAIIATLDLAKSFGKDTVFAVFGLIIFNVIGYAILAFGGAQYRGPAALAPKAAY